MYVYTYSLCYVGCAQYYGRAFISITINGR